MIGFALMGNFILILAKDLTLVLQSLPILVIDIYGFFVVWSLKSQFMNYPDWNEKSTAVNYHPQA